MPTPLTPISECSVSGTTPQADSPNEHVIKPIQFNTAKFHLSHVRLTDPTVLATPQVAFLGRSNSGKSSLLNQVCRQKKLARTSKTPGRTRELILFSISNSGFLVDLPGYGYAKASLSLRKQWEAMITNYLQRTPGLYGLVVTIDIRRLLQPMDWQLIKSAQLNNLSVCVFLTKADKLKSQMQFKAFSQIKQELVPYDLAAPILGSSKTGQGIEELRLWLDKKLTRGQDSV